jgi:hypothetical protein
LRWALGSGAFDLREDVVHDMVLDDAMEDVAANEAKLAIHCRHSAFLVCPSSLLIVWRFGVRVVEVSDGD